MKNEKKEKLPVPIENHIVLINESDVAAKIAILRGNPVIKEPFCDQSVHRKGPLYVGDHPEK